MVKKHFDLVVVVLLVLALVFYDVTLELMAETVHFFFELLFQAFEWFELGVEHLIEHVFHTEHHTSQLITFYFLLGLGGYVVYMLWRVLPELFTYCRQVVGDAWLRRKMEWELYWLSLTLSYKIILAITALGVAYLASFFVL